MPVVVSEVLHHSPTIHKPYSRLLHDKKHEESQNPSTHCTP